MHIILIFIVLLLLFVFLICSATPVFLILLILGSVFVLVLILGSRQGPFGCTTIGRSCLLFVLIGRGTASARGFSRGLSIVVIFIVRVASRGRIEVVVVRLGVVSETAVARRHCN